jgi:lipopolysaccharide assembly outer membrane protein LptD (OstA)
MKLLTLSLCIACLPLFPQDREARALRANEQTRQSFQIAKSIFKHQPFQLPEMALGTSVKVTAMKFLAYDGYVLRLGGVELTTDTLTVQADELTYTFATGEIEPLGNVRLKPARQ